MDIKGPSQAKKWEKVASSGNAVSPKRPIVKFFFFGLIIYTDKFIFNKMHWDVHMESYWYMYNSINKPMIIIV